MNGEINEEDKKEESDFCWKVFLYLNPLFKAEKLINHD